METRETQACFECKAQKPAYDSNGQHNFCPHMADEGVVYLCSECKSARLKDRKPQRVTKWQ